MKRSKAIKFLSLSLALLLALSLFACGDRSSTPDTNGNPAASPDKDLPVSIAVLSGTTGMGIAKLAHDTAAGQASLSYQIEVFSSADMITPGLITGEFAIAALPTNVASLLYQKTNGQIMVAAVNTKGVLYLLENGNTVNSLEDLRGKTVCLPGKGSNPEYILRALCRSAGLDPDKDLTLDDSYTSPDELATAVASGLVDLAVLPEPKVTAVKTQNNAIRTALDFTEEWNTVYGGEKELVQGCLVIQKAFAENHPAELKQFLADYAASVQFVSDPDNLDAAADMIAESGILPKAAVAKKALPACHICYMDGEPMKASLSAFFRALYEVAPASIGGALPDDGIYYIAQ